MLEKLVTVGAPSFFPYVNTLSGGAGGLCSEGVISGFLNGQHKFLPFKTNAINCTTTEGQDVISAHFTGCIMAVYTEGGVRKVCHISTGADYGDCKAEWDRLKAGYSNVFEFRPSDFVGGTPNTRCYGLITAELATYTILLQPKRVALAGGGMAASDLQFAKIVKASLLRG